MDSDIPLYSQLVRYRQAQHYCGHIKLRRTITVGSGAVQNLLLYQSQYGSPDIGSLEAEGLLVVRKQGRGTFVAEPKMRRKTENVYSFTSEISSMGLTPSSTLIEFEIITPTPDIMKVLELSSTEKSVYRFTRIRHVNDRPLILETSFYPQYIYPKLTRAFENT